MTVRSRLSLPSQTNETRIATPIEPATPTAIPRDDDAYRLYAVLSDLVRVYQLRARDDLCSYDISVAQWYALDSLARHPSIGFDTLAAELFLDRSSVSRLVGTLARRGYVTREQRPSDGRAVVIALTPAGRHLHLRIERGLVERTRRLLDELEPAMRDVWAAVLTRFVQTTPRSSRQAADLETNG